jgi:large subunit ribosomal protein L10
MARPDKVAAVQEIADRFNEVNAALLTEYRGLSVSDIAEVRKALRAVDADYKVLKNTLARIAVREVGLDELVDMLEGPTAIAFVRGDAVEAAKALDQAAGRFPVLAIKGGMLRGGRVIGAEEAKRLAKLESREALLATIAMMANQPAQRLANVLSALLRDLGSMLAQVVAKKESGELPGDEAEAPAAGAERSKPEAAEGGEEEQASEEEE